MLSPNLYEPAAFVSQNRRYDNLDDQFWSVEHSM